MKVIRGFSTDKDQPSTSPFRDRNGIFLEFRGGDFCHPDLWHPFSGGKWFTEPFFNPNRVTRFFFKWPLFPFISYRFGNRVGYAGAKIYGADAQAYKRWLPPSDVYEGSQAIMFSIRPFAKVDK